jgi:hypothetical protein
MPDGRRPRPRWTAPTIDDSERRRLKRWLWLAVLGLVGIGVVLVYVGEPMTSDGGRNIVAFELADSGAVADEIIEGWGTEGRTAARWSLMLDYVWLVLYSAVLMIGAVLVATMAHDRDWHRVERLGWLVAGLALVAGLLDALENSVLLWQLSHGADDVTAFVARAAATLKFLLVAVAMVYIAVVGVTCFFRRPERERLPSFRERPVAISRRVPFGERRPQGEE